MELMTILKDLSPSVILVIALFFMSRNTSKVLPQAIATTSQVVSGIEGLRADLRDDRQTLSNHNEQSIQRQSAVLQGFDRVSNHIDTLTKVLEGLLAGQQSGHNTAARLQETIGGLSGTMSEMKDTMEKLNDVPTLLKEIRDAIQSVEGKVDQILSEVEPIKIETREIKERVNVVETAIKAQAESTPPQVTVNNTTIDSSQETNQ